MLVNILLLIAGLALLMWGADRFVHGAAAAARNLGIQAATGDGGWKPEV